MADGFAVDVAEIHQHAARIEGVRQRCGAVRAASAAIARDDAAYGLLCGWISGILQERHARQDQLLSYVEENLRLAADALVRTGHDYERSDDGAADRIRRAGHL